MFKQMSVANFKVGEHEACIMVDRAMPAVSLQLILNKLMHFCVERQKEADNEIAQAAKDAEAERPPKLEAEKPPEEETPSLSEIAEKVKEVEAEKEPVT